MHALPRLLVPLGTLVLVVVGTLAPLPVALAAFGIVLAFLAWIAYLSWPAVGLSGRAMRLAMLVLVVVLAGTRF